MRFPAATIANAAAAATVNSGGSAAASAAGGHRQPAGAETARVAARAGRGSLSVERTDGAGAQLQQQQQAKRTKSIRSGGGDERKGRGGGGPRAEHQQRPMWRNYAGTFTPKKWGQCEREEKGVSNQEIYEGGGAQPLQSWPIQS